MADLEQAALPEVDNEAEVLLESAGTMEVEAQTLESSDEGEQDSEEFEIILGSAEQPSAEEKTAKKPRGVKRLLNERRENRQQLSAQEQRIAELEQQLARGQTTTQVNAVPVPPTLESVGYDDDALAQASQKYQQDLHNYQQSLVKSVIDQQQHGTERARQQEQMNSVINAHYDRAEKLNLPDFDDAEGKLVEILDQGAVAQIAQMIPNSEAVVYYLGKNPEKAYQIREIWERNPGQAAVELGGLSRDVQIRPKKKQQRPQPESKIAGGAPSSKSQIEREIDKERNRIANGETNDLTYLNKLKGQLRNASA